MNRVLSCKLYQIFCIRRGLSTHFSHWTTLGKTFNQRPMKDDSKTSPKKGLFNVPELDGYDGFFTLKEQCIIATEALMHEITDLKRNPDFIRLAHPSQSYTQAAEQACGAVSGLVERLNTDKRLYDALHKVVNLGDKHSTNVTDDHVAKLFLFDFEQSGIHLPENLRNHVVLLNDQILRLGQQFVSQAAHPRIVPKSVIPEHVQHLFPPEGNNVVINGLNVDSPNSIAREVSYKIYLCSDHLQDETLKELLKSRHELAVTCGFETYAERALRGSMLDTPRMVTDFLNHLSSDLKRSAEDDFNLMLNIKKGERGEGFLAAWDVPYYTQKYKKAMLNVSASDFSPYFSLGACMEGLNTIFKNLYGITLEANPVSADEVWVTDVYKLAVIHETEGILGYIYCDFYERIGKPNQDCHFTIRGGRNLNGQYQQPVVVLMLNLPLPRWSTPTLLTPSMVDNLFHEMGHAMHSMLGRTEYQHVTGTRCSTDLAEVPSVLMEYFARDPRILKTFARHFQTNEPMPDNMLELLCASKNVFMASEMQMQVFYSMVDQHFHNGYPLKGNSMEVLANVQNNYYSLPYVPNTAWHLRFTHLVGYGAKYYSYLVSTALASWIWHACFDQNPLCRVQGERYRRNFLAHGGGKPPWALISDFLQREPSPAMLAGSLVSEVENKRERLDVYIRKSK
ncbi:mitochondrial intermediate peptidase isoform X2 [Atheta coriaria]|uniref:mitochondrial intermediate peptidase isoform X2 n=1 Tax=Dalotia coriaria TaxID=877792 RepID=UPI0031F34285